ncbi:MAG: hypothetical protein Q7S61_02105 [bacterium]|nr:hypothetical protein [bacterium]
MTDPNTPTTPKPNLEAYGALIELDQKEHNFKARNAYFKGYLWSILLPPIGIYYFIKFVFFSNGTPEDIKAGIVSLVLTIVVFILSIWLSFYMFKQTTSSLSPESSKFLQELITPGNQNSLKDLYK